MIFISFFISIWGFKNSYKIVFFLIIFYCIYIMPRYRKYKTRKVSNTKQVIANKKAISRIKSSREVKRKFFNINAFTSTGIPIFFDMNSMSKGSSSVNREGNEIVMKSFSFCYSLLSLDTILSNVSTTRIILYVNRDNNLNANDDLGKILQDISTSLNTIKSTYDEDFVGKGKQYQILYDRKHTMVIGSKSSTYINKYIRLGHKILFANTNFGTSEDISKQALRLIFLSVDTDAQFGWSSTLRFIDP